MEHYLLFLERLLKYNRSTPLFKTLMVSLSLQILEWLVGFSYDPNFLRSKKDYGFYLISKDGQIGTVFVNTEKIDEVVHRLESPTFYINYWSFEWVNYHLLKVTFRVWRGSCI